MFVFRQSVSSFRSINTGILIWQKRYCNLVQDKNLLNRYLWKYQDAINISLYDPNITTADAINQGFALLLLNKNAYTGRALACFEKASKLDHDNRYSQEIQCGINEAHSHANYINHYHIV
jgi:hypothetical protein